MPRRGDLDATDGLFALDFVDGVSSLLLGILIALTLALALVLVWPLLALAVELIALVFIALAGLIGRLLFRRPWRIVATTAGPPEDELAWDVPGWRASREAIEIVETALRAGTEPRAPDARSQAPRRISSSEPEAT